jgi:glutamate formiminotransferase/formiminotetrahydrofolate cyclodeaminase
MEISDQAWKPMCEAARFGNLASKSDIQVGARALECGIWGAYQNVVINLPGIRDESFKKETLDRAGKIAERARQKMQEVMEILENRDSNEK